MSTVPASTLRLQELTLESNITELGVYFLGLTGLVGLPKGGGTTGLGTALPVFFGCPGTFAAIVTPLYIDGDGLITLDTNRIRLVSRIASFRCLGVDKVGIEPTRPSLQN